MSAFTSARSRCSRAAAWRSWVVSPRHNRRISGNRFRADDLNARFRQLVGEEFSVKDLRTWHGTVLAAEGFATAREPTSKTARRRAEAAVMRAVSEDLGNTPAVARSSYVDPRVVLAYEQGITIRPVLQRVQRQRHPVERQHLIERATARLIKRVDKD
ncbi:hypothetical protein [uncultured Mycobacterium sp.]|uniref:hypothetical protein n=1 Tax=uncultured Mycobacterium sp. TaxID=171292 RepID=UPI0035C9B3EC